MQITHEGSLHVEIICEVISSEYIEDEYCQYLIEFLVNASTEEFELIEYINEHSH